MVKIGPAVLCGILSVSVIACFPSLRHANKKKQERENISESEVVVEGESDDKIKTNEEILAELSSLQESVKNMEERYAKARERHDVLLDSSYELQKEADRFAIQLSRVDDASAIYASSVLKLHKYADDHCPLDAGNQASFVGLVDTSEETRQSVFEIMSQAEESLLKTLAALRVNAEKVYETPETRVEELAKLEQDLVDQNNELSGIRGLLLTTQIGLESRKASCGLVPAGGAGQATIAIEDEDRQLQGAGAGTAVSRTSAGNVSIIRSVGDVKTYASSNGYDVEGAEDAFKIAKDSGGFMRFADSDQDLAQGIKDIISGIKIRMNSNSENLELAFVLDYSGSMSDDIAAVIKNLVEITKGLRAIQQSGRTVKIGIVSFGEPGKEKINLDLSDNLALVERTLNVLHAGFQTHQHSTNPGEASYYGMDIATSKLKWDDANRKNRNMILITDEPSYSLQTGDTAYATKVSKKMHDSNVNLSVYPILVK